jgi:hypothetical protein
MRWLARLFGFLVASFVVFIALNVLWAVIIIANGGAIFECDRGDCGRLGNWSHEHGRLVFIVIVALALLLGFFAVYSVVRLRAKSGAD